MKKIAFSITIIGIFILLVLLNHSKPIINPSNLTDLQPNQKVSVTGEVLEEKYTKSSKILLINNKEIVCDLSCPKYLNKNISVLGLIDLYNSKKQIIALRIKN